MTSLTLSFFGPPEQKHVVKVPPMQTLKDVLQSASTKFRPALVAEHCDLQLNKKAVDVNTPFRLLNIPAGSKLEIIKRTHSSAPAAVVAPATAAAATTSSSTAAQPATSTATANTPSDLAAPAAAGPAAAATVADTAGHPQAAKKPDPPKQVAFSEHPAAAAAAAAAAGSSSQATAAAAQPSRAAAAPAAAAVQPELAALGIQRPIYVFHQRALEAAAEAARSSSAMDTDPPDAFFDLTADDLARMQQQANAKKQQEAVFRTRAAREAEDARAAAALGPVRVRLHWPDGTLLQSEFKATDPLAQVQDLVHKCAAPQYAPALYLYTTPPKTVLKDSAASLCNLKLVPAAHIYVGIDDKKVASGAAAAVTAAGSDQSAAQGGGASIHSSLYLKPEVQVLMQDHVPQQIQQQRQQGEAGVDRGDAGSEAAAVAEAQRAMRAAAAASRTEARGGDEGGGSKVPKWLKVGKK